MQRPCDICMSYLLLERLLPSGLLLPQPPCLPLLRPRGVSMVALVGHLATHAAS